MLRRYLLSASSLLVLVPLANAQTSGAAVPEGSKAPVPNAPMPSLVAPDSSNQSNPCGDCVVEQRGPWNQIWGSVAYARWVMRDAPFATPLASTGTGFNPGALGDPNTVILFGDSPLDFGGFNGLRFEGGVWLNNNHTTGVGFGLTTFGSKSFTSVFDSNTNGPSVISRPIFDAQAFQQVGLLVANPDVNVSGSLTIENKAQFYGFDLHGRQNLLNNETVTIDGILGFRYFNLSEQLLITQRSQYDGDGETPLQVNQITYGTPLFDPVSHLINQTVTSTPVNSLVIEDSFQTRNQVYGVELGAHAEARWGTFYTNFTGKVTFGVNQERIDVFGSTRDGANTVREPNGVLAVRGIAPVSTQTGLPVYVGTGGEQRYNQFVVMPEFTFQVGMQVTSHLRLFVGYDWLYINDVVRPGNQIDPVINQRYVPSSPAYGTLAGPNAPNYPLSHTDFVAHGFSIGIELQY